MNLKRLKKLVDSSKEGSLELDLSNFVSSLSEKREAALGKDPLEVSIHPEGFTNKEWKKFIGILKKHKAVYFDPWTKHGTKNYEVVFWDSLSDKDKEFYNDRKESIGF